MSPARQDIKPKVTIELPSTDMPNKEELVIKKMKEYVPVPVPIQQSNSVEIHSEQLKKEYILVQQDGTLKCDACEKIYQQKHSLLKHLQSNHNIT